MKLKDKQILYSFSQTEYKEEEVPVIEKQEDGSEKKVLQLKKTPIEKTFVFKIPNRREMEDLEMFYSVKVNHFVKMGLMTKDMIMKQYLDNGGELSDQEQKDFFEKSKDLFDAQNEYYMVSSKADKTELEESREKELLEKIYILRRELATFEEIKNNIFEHTADTKARNKTLLYCVLFFTYIEGEKDGEKDYTQFFKGKEYSDKESKFYELEEEAVEKDDEQFSEIFDTMSLVSLFYFMHNITDKEQMNEAIKTLKQQEQKDIEYDEALLDDEEE